MKRPLVSTKSRRWAAVLWSACALLVSPWEADADDTGEILRFLREHFGVSAADTRRLAAGSPIVRSLPTQDGREIATFGAIRVPVSSQAYLSQLRDIANFKQHAAVLQIGVFGRPAQPSDARTLTLPDGMTPDLADCRPADCDVQLSAAGMARLRAASARGGVSEVTSEFAALLAEMVEAYRRVGGPALMTYVDDDEPVVVDREFTRLVSEAPAILQRFPPLLRAVQHGPATQSPGVEELVYWSRERLGPADVVSVTHLALAHALAIGPVTAAAVSRQLYASRYFDASMGLTLLLETRDDGRPVTYLAYVNRSRIDALGGWFGAIKRPIVRSRTRSGMKDALTRLQRRMEQHSRDTAP